MIKGEWRRYLNVHSEYFQHFFPVGATVSTCRQVFLVDADPRGLSKRQMRKAKKCENCFRLKDALRASSISSVRSIRTT